MRFAGRPHETGCGAPCAHVPHRTGTPRTPDSARRTELKTSQKNTTFVSVTVYVCLFVSECTWAMGHDYPSVSVLCDGPFEANRIGPRCASLFLLDGELDGDAHVLV